MFFLAFGGCLVDSLQLRIDSMPKEKPIKVGDKSSLRNNGNVTQTAVALQEEEKVLIGDAVLDLQSCWTTVCVQRIHFPLKMFNIFCVFLTIILEYLREKFPGRK